MPVERRRIAIGSRMGTAAALALLWLGNLWAADLVVTNARLFKGTDEPVLHQANIAIADGRIERIWTGALEGNQTGVIDAGGRTVMPGMIDPHVHVFFDLQDGANFPTDEIELSHWLQGEVPDLLDAYLRAGFTTILAPIDFWPAIAEVRDRVTSGHLESPRLLIAGGVFVAPGGHYICRRLSAEKRSWCDSHLTVPMNDSRAIEAAVDEYASRGVDVLVLDSVTNAPELQHDAISSLVRQADLHQLRVLVHTSTADRVAALVDLGVDGFLHPPGGAGSAQNGSFARAGALNIPVAVTIGEQEELILSGRATAETALAYEQSLENVRELEQAGATIVYGTDMPGALPETSLPIAIRALAGLGLTHDEVLKAVTRDAASRMLGLTDVGTIEEGNVADLIILDGDPLEDLGALSKVRMVIQDGQVVVGH